MMTITHNLAFNVRHAISRRQNRNYTEQVTPRLDPSVRHYRTRHLPPIMASNGGSRQRRKMPAGAISRGWLI